MTVHICLFSFLVRVEGGGRGVRVKQQPFRVQEARIRSAAFGKTTRIVAFL